MCVVSMVMDHYWDKWNPQGVPVAPLPTLPRITPEEIAEFKRLLERAREYDKKHNEPDCELAEKKAKILKLAEELGVKIDFLS